jgi:hypothetical protein
MTVMHGAFDPRFPVPDDDALLVGGPLHWDGDELGANIPAATITIVAVRVEQDGNEAGATPGTVWNRPDDDTRARDHWPAELPVVPGTFTTGRATGVVSAHVKLTDDTELDEEWVHEFVLVVAAPLIHA